MSPKSIAEFIAHARSKGMDHQTIRMLLLSAGWKEKDISQALASETLEIPVPAPPDSGSARDSFFRLLGLAALASTVTSLCLILFECCDWFTQDPNFDAQFNDYAEVYQQSAIRGALATLIVALPLFLWMSRLIHRECCAHPEKLASGMRRWLTYLILFVTSSIVLGDLVWIITEFLGGELTTRFALKAATLTVLCGLPFIYHYQSLRLDASNYASSRLHRTFLWLCLLLSMLALGWGFFMAGSPAYGRRQQLDARRITDLRVIHQEIRRITLGEQLHTRGPGALALTLLQPLPPTLEDVSKKATYKKVPLKDPLGNAYEYRVTSEGSYELCVEFALPRDISTDIFWNHGAGRHCFPFDALRIEGR